MGHAKVYPGYPALHPVFVPQVGANSGGAYPGNATAFEGYASGTLTLTGTPTVGEQIAVDINGHTVTYTLVSGDSTLTIAAASLTTALNNDSTNSAIITATSSGAVITITANAKGEAGQYSLSATSYASGTVTIGGTPAATNTVVVTINGHAVTYVLLSGDTTAAIVAGHVATAINNDSTDAAIVLATANGAVISIQALAAGATGEYTLTTSVTGGGVTSTASAAALALVVATASDSELDYANSVYIPKVTFNWLIGGQAKTYYKDFPYVIDATDAAAMRAAGYLD